MSAERPGPATGSTISAYLATRGLCWQQNGQQILDDISVEIARGDIMAVAGASGAGKSSFLRLLNRLAEPTSGHVYLEGQDYTQLPPQELRRRLGMVMQLPFLFPGTVANNIRFGPEQRGESLSDGEISSLLDRVRLEGYAEREVSNLSTGEAQRVSLARTLANEPEALLLDEPTSALDQRAQQDVEELILEIIRDQGLTCLIVTHDMDQARRMAERAMLMEGGRLVAVGPAEEILDAD